MKCPICKKDIPDDSLKCPHCKTRVGLLCEKCNTVNQLNSLTCKNCNNELLKICTNCHSINYPNAKTCRKCGSPFSANKQEKNKPEQKTEQNDSMMFVPELLYANQALHILKKEILSKKYRIFSITGEKGIGKTTLLYNLIKECKESQTQWVVGTCSQLTQVTPGGVIQNILLNLFQLPEYYTTFDELIDHLKSYMKKIFKTFDEQELEDFLNFLYNFKDGKYEDIIINKKKTYKILSKAFETISQKQRTVIVINNLDFIDGFSIEFLTNFLQENFKNKNIKFIAIYNKHRPVHSYFEPDKENFSYFYDIHLAKPEQEDIENKLKLTSENGLYVTDREKEIIFQKANNNPSFAEQAVQYCYDCQIGDRAFTITKDFKELIKSRLEILKKINIDAYKIICVSALIGNKINRDLLFSTLGYQEELFNSIISFLIKSKYLYQYNENYYSFKNIWLWETIINCLKGDKVYEEINVKIIKELSRFSLNTNTIMAIISHNMRENRMAFDIWTKTTRLASYIGDINLYVIAQKQCLALLNEFNENETLDIRYNISERLGKLLTNYNPEEALEFLPDAIQNAKVKNEEVKEIELLGYLALSCKKIKNYFGDIECVNNVLQKLTDKEKIETALVKSTKMHSLLQIGNYEEVVNTIDNDIMPVITQYLSKPSLAKTISLNMISDIQLKLYLIESTALAMQGNSRVFEVLKILFSLINKQLISNGEIICKAKLVQAYAYTMKGDFIQSEKILSEIADKIDIENIKVSDISETGADITNYSNYIKILNRVMQQNYTGIQEDLYNMTVFAQDTNDILMQNMFKMFLGKFFADSKQSKHALEIYNNEITYFSNEKIATGALIGWYFIAEANLNMERERTAVDIASRALEIAQNPKINNIFLIVALKILLTRCHIILSDYETAKIHLETAKILAKRHDLKYLLEMVDDLFEKYYKN